MKSFLVMFLKLMFISLCLNAQTSLQNDIAGRLRYPADALSNKISGLVVLRVLVNADGTVADHYVVLGKGGGCTDHVLQILKNTRWKELASGITENRTYIVPVRFYHVAEIEERFSSTEISLDTIFADSYAEEKKHKAGLTVEERMPEFPGGEKAMMKYLITHLRYPKNAQENVSSGRVLVSFSVDTNGSVTEVTTLRGVGDGCDEEAVRVVEGMPLWKPGEQNGKKVKVLFSLPVTFSMEVEKPPKKFRDATRLDTMKVYNSMFAEPVFKGGAFEFEKQLRTLIIKETGPLSMVKGTVKISFIVDQQGTVQNPRLLQGLDVLIDEAVLRAVSKLKGFRFVWPFKKDTSFTLEVPFKT